MTLNGGRGEISGKGVNEMKGKLSLEPDIEKHVPVLMGNHKQLCVVRDEDRIRTLRDELTIDRIDWKSAEASSERAKDAFRLLASPIDVRVLSYTPRRSVRLSFPDEISKIGLLGSEQAVVVVVFGEFIEFWNPTGWRTFLETTVGMQDSAPHIVESLINDETDHPA